MKVWVVLRYYNSRTDNMILDVFASKDKAIKCVASHIAEDKKMAKLCGYKVEWEKPYNHGPHKTIYQKKDSEESYEITEHTLLE